MPLSKEQVEAHLAVIEISLQALRVGLIGVPEPAPIDDGPRCPQCGEENKLLPSSVMGEAARLTCGQCGKSFPGELPGEEVVRG